MNHKFRSLDVFRGIFASMIFLFHLYSFSDTRILRNSFVMHADIFVDFFFVLSGFVITFRYTTISSPGDFISFIKKRFQRIYPLHFVMLVTFLLIETSKGYLQQYIHINQPTNPNNNIFSFTSSLFLFNSVKIPNVNDVSWNIQSWSISAEMIAYILFGILMVTIYKIGIVKKTPVFILVIIASCLILFRINGNYSVFNTYDFGFIRGCIGFLFGAVCFHTYDSVKEYGLKISRIFFTVTEVILVIMIIFMTINYEVVKVFSLNYHFIFFLTILVFSFDKGRLSNYLNGTKFLVNLGTYSYSIYMTHTFLISLFNILFIRLLKLPPSSYSYLFILNFYIIYLVSKWTYHNIEMKFRNKKTK